MWTVKDLEAPRSTQEIALAHVRSNYNHERLIFFSKTKQMAMVQMVVPGSLPIGHLLQAWFSP